jgi:hypothetical protein
MAAGIGSIFLASNRPTYICRRSSLSNHRRGNRTAHVAHGTRRYVFSPRVRHQKKSRLVHSGNQVASQVVVL